MGVCFSHGTAHWSYNGFHIVRVLIAEAIGVGLNRMSGYSLTGAGISWSTVKSPLKYLLNHSDSCGHITYRRCELVKNELERIMPDLEKIMKGDQIEMLKSLMEGLEEAYQLKENFEFL